MALEKLEILKNTFLTRSFKFICAETYFNSSHATAISVSLPKKRLLTPAKQFLRSPFLRAICHKIQEPYWTSHDVDQSIRFHKCLNAFSKFFCSFRLLRILAVTSILMFREFKNFSTLWTTVLILINRDLVH